MIKKASLKKKTKYIVSRWAKKYGLLKTMQSISREKYAEKISASLFYGLLSAIAVNFFFQPGHVYSSGATGLAQVLSAISERLIGFRLPISIVFYAINLPLLILAWYKIGHKFTVFTLITVSMSSFFIQIVPEITLTTDPLVNAIFGGLVMGTGVGFSLKSRISSGVTSCPEKVIAMSHTKLHRGVTQINNAEGTYNHEKKAVLLAIITREEYNDFRYLMRKTDPKAFVSVAENVHIIGRFVDD